MENDPGVELLIAGNGIERCRLALKLRILYLRRSGQSGFTG